MGAAAVRIASAMGCRVLAVTSKPDKVAFLESLGATSVIVSPDLAFHKDKAVRALGGVDLVMECVGAPTFNASLRSLRHGGRLVVAGIR